MGLMDQFRPQQQQPSSLSDLFAAARQTVGNNDPRPFLKRISDSGMTCNLPDGRVMRVSDLVSMAEGKTPQQFLSQLGLS